MRSSVEMACVAMICAIVSVSHPEGAVAAADNAADPAYADGWQAGDNGGTGFLPWTLDFSGVPPLQQPGPNFIDTNTSPPLPGNTLGPPAFGLTTSARPSFDDTSGADRKFAAPLAVGSIFIIDIDGSALNSSVPPFTAGNTVQLFGSDNTERFGIFTNNDFQNENWVAPGGAAGTNTGVPAGDAFRVEFTLKSANAYDFVMRPLDGGDPLFSQSDRALSGTPGVAINRLRITTYGNGSSAAGTLEIFFNNIEIIEPASVWNVDSNGNWKIAANWTGSVPNAVGAEAIFGNRITAPRTVTVDGPITAGRIDFDNANAYTITGANALTLDASDGDAQISVATGSHFISAPITLADNTAITVTPATSNLSITGAISAASVNISKGGAGTLTVSNVRAAGLAINGGTVAIAPGGSAAGTSAVGALTIAGATDAWTAKYDVNDNDAVVHSSAASKEADFARLYNQLKSGFDGGVWTGTGITSSTAATNPTADTGLSLVDNALLAASDFSGQPVNENSLLLKYTYYGDIDLNGQVDGEDLTVFALNFGRTTGATQVDGDIDFNGRVDGEDLTVFANNFGKGIGSPLAAGAVAAVPEPASLVLAALGAAAVYGWTARRRMGNR